MGYRQSEVSELCAVCRAATDTLCERCERPLCAEHLSTDEMCCPLCEMPCVVCSVPTDKERACPRCTSVSCEQHQAKSKLCDSCERDWVDHELPKTNRRAWWLYSAMTAYLWLAFGVMSGFLGAGFLFAATVTLPAFLLYKSPKRARKAFIEAGSPPRQLTNGKAPLETDAPAE